MTFPLESKKMSGPSSTLDRTFQHASWNSIHSKSPPGLLHVTSWRKGEEGALTIERWLKAWKWHRTQSSCSGWIPFHSTWESQQFSALGCIPTKCHSTNSRGDPRHSKTAGWIGFIPFVWPHTRNENPFLPNSFDGEWITGTFGNLKTTDLQSAESVTHGYWALHLLLKQINKPNPWSHVDDKSTWIFIATNVPFIKN